MKTEDVKRRLSNYRSIEELPTNHRERVIDILKAIYKKVHISKGELYKLTKISPSYFEAYVYWLTKVGMVIVDKKGRYAIVELTTKGKELLEREDRQSTLKPMVLKFLEEFRKVVDRNPTLQEAASWVKATPGEVEPILYEAGWSSPKHEDFLREKLVRAKALMVASCIRHGLAFSKLIDGEKVSDLDVERAAYYLKGHPEWVPRLGENYEGKILPIWDSNLIDRGIVKREIFIGGYVAVYSQTRLYGGCIEGSHAAESLKLFKEVKEARKPLGVCEKCGDMVAYEDFRGMKLCVSCIREER